MQRLQIYSDQVFSLPFLSPFAKNMFAMIELQDITGQSLIKHSDFKAKLNYNDELFEKIYSELLDVQLVETIMVHERIDFLMDDGTPEFADLYQPAAAVGPVINRSRNSTNPEKLQLL